MFSIGCRRIRFLLVVAIMLFGVTSIAEARHWRHYGHYFYRHNLSEPDRDAGEARDQEPVAPTSGYGQSRNGASRFAEGIRQMIGACAAQASELKAMPFDTVSQTVQAGENQRNALEQIRSAASAAADSLAAACPKDIPAKLSQRLDKLGIALDAIAASLATLRPAFTAFYDSLDDEQKTRLAVIDFSRQPQPRAERGARLVADGRAADSRSGAEQDRVCRQWGTILRSWPIGQLDTGMALSDEQHAALYDVTAAIYRVIGSLVAACPTDSRLTPLDRLDAKQRQLQALRQGIDAIQPLLAAFENSLNEAQRAQLAAAVF